LIAGAQSGFLDVVQICLDLDADTTIVNHEGKSVKDVIPGGHRDIIELLRQWS